MALATLCPHCGTGFRVTSQQLQQRDGLVRCGQCQRVFSGPAGLAEIPEVEGVTQQPVSTPDPAQSQSQSQSLPLPAREGTDFLIPPPEPVTDVPGPGAPRISVPAPNPRPSPPRGGRAGARFVAGLLIVLLLAALAVGCMFLRRDWLMLHVPWSAPAIHWLGAQIGVVTHPSAQLASLSVERRELAPGEAPGQFVLRGVLRNTGAQAVRWPSIALSLHDINGAPVLRRSVSAAEYLAGQTTFDEASGLPAGGEIELRFSLALNDGAPEPVGYGIAPYYP